VIDLIDFALFIQSGYSFNGSIIDIGKLVGLARDKGFKTLGLADRNHLYGAVKFHNACTLNGIKPIIGLNVSVKSELFRELPLVLYAKNTNGYMNLVKTSSHISLTEDSLDISILEKYSKDLFCICLTSGGDLHRAIVSGDFAFANQVIRFLEEKVETLYLGLDLGDFETETKVAPELARLYQSVILNQVLYYSKEDKHASDILRALLDAKPLEPGMLSAEETLYDFITPEKLTAIYDEYKQAVATTRKLIDAVDFNFEFGKLYLPKYPAPDGHEANQYLRALAVKGLQKRLRSKLAPIQKPAVYEERLEHELKIIAGMGYADYFLIVWDFVLYAKHSGILVGPGRGSSAGSLVAYTLGIVDVDPLEHDLYFERFLNPERITMPDIDMDFPDDKRDQVIQYVVDKYGKNHVTSIVAFGTFQGKSALRDVARVLDIKDMIIDEVTKYVGETDNSIELFKRNYPEKYKYLASIPEVRELFTIAEKLVDLPRHISTHAAGIIITDREVTDHVPIQKGLMNMYQTQFEAQDLEELGLLKIDFLGIRNLTTIQRVVDLVKERTGKTIDIYKLPLDDARTYQLLCDVKTLGIFQLESQGMMNLLRKMQIRNFADISTCIALFRPGPMENIPAYLRRLNKKERITYLDLLLEPILASTKGIIVYQEQIMQIAHVYAGYSLGEADVLRRAVSKKKEAILLEERQKFLAKCRELGRDEAVSNQIYDYIVKFANYGFNKSHSVAYSVVAYWMAYLKANYPGYFMAVLMDSALGSQTATRIYIRECLSLGIGILPPKINLSGKFFRIENDSLRFPFLGIRNIGSVVAEKIDEIQRKGQIKSFVDFVFRSRDINTRVIESLILVGVFDDFSETKQTMIENLRQIMMSLNLGQNLEELGFVYVRYPEYDSAYLAAKEKELLGFNLSYHPLTSIRKKLAAKGIRFLSEHEFVVGEDVVFAGLLKKTKQIKTRNGDDMAFLEFEDMFQSTEAILFPQEFRAYGSSLAADGIYIVYGKTEQRNNQLQVVIKKLESVKEE